MARRGPGLRGWLSLHFPGKSGRDFAACGDNLCLQRIDIAAVLARLDALLAA